MNHDTSARFVRGRVRESVPCCDAKAMTVRVANLQKACGDALQSHDYSAVFRSFDIDNKPMLIGAVGRLAGFRIRVSADRLTGTLDSGGETVDVMTVKPERPWDSLPFDEVFAMAGRLRQALGRHLSPELTAVPVLGGIQSLILRDEPQVIADYYLPEIVSWQNAERSLLFTAEGLPEIPPFEAEAEAAAVPEGTSCPMKAWENCPGREEYTRRMGPVLEALRSGAMQKVVVARRVGIVPDPSFDSLDYAAFLYDRYFQEYFYMFRQGGSDTYLGISPEIIMKMRGRRAVTKPLAGTRKKTDDEALNRAVREELTATDKDITEHEYALYFMADGLKKAGIGDVRIDRSKTVLETPYAFHIKSEISMDLNSEADCFDVIGAIYPPATIWGIPVAETEHLLAKTEPFARGYFTGVFGYWNFEDEADTALVIRTARLGEDGVSLYAGGGIVRDSDIEAEYDETVNKMRPLFGYFTGI